MKRKIYLLFIPLLLFSVLLSSCATETVAPTAEPEATEPPAPTAEPEEPTAEPEAAEPIELSFWYEWDETNNPAAYAWSPEVIAAYEAANPGVIINAEAIPDQQYDTKFQTAVASGQAPDAFMVRPGGWFKTYIDEGVVVSLDDYLAADGWGDTFLSSAMSVCTYEDSVFCLPGGIRSVQVWYNAAQFADLGVEPATTWEEMTALADVLLENGVVPFALGNKEAWEAPLIYEYLLIRIGGYDAFAAAAARDGSASFADPVFVEAGEMLAQMSADGWLPEGANGLEFGDMLGQFFSGEASMAVFLNVMPGIASGAAPEGFELAYFNFPTIEGGDGTSLISSIGGAWAISANSENPEQTADFLRFWTSKENMAALSTSAGWVMPVNDTVQQDAVDEMTWAFYEDIINAENMIPFLNYALTPDTSEAIFLGLQQIVDGSLDAATVMENWEATAVEDYGQ